VTIDYSSFLARDTFAVFLFHGVVRSNRRTVRNYTKKHLLMERFQEILDSLAAAGVAISMPQIAVAAEAGKPLPPRAFAITFDDGFANNYSLAAPLLEKMDMPAAFYVTTGFVDANGSSWIDRIEYAVELVPGVHLRTPAVLSGSYSSASEKRDLLDRIRRLVKCNRDIDPYAFAAEFCDQLGVQTMDPDPELDQKLNWDQVRELHSNELFTVGGHGHTHRILEYLPRSELEGEIALSIETLERRLGTKVEHYSYPEGLAYCYSDRVIEVLRRHGIRCSPSAEHGINRHGEDLFRLKRIMVAS
jgi:peptidoglycan/xylan/chitin deacetylase (PgdA/CDA1 family)